MEFVRAWCIRIVGVLILSVLCEGILPSGDVKKYVRLLTGLILTICVCRPITGGVGTEISVGRAETEAYFESEKMEEKERENVLRLYRANLGKRMNEDLRAVIGGCEFEFQIEVESKNMNEFGKIKGVIVTVVTSDGELYVNDLVERVISEKYGVGVNNIAVNYRSK